MPVDNNKTTKLVLFAALAIGIGIGAALTWLLNPKTATHTDVSENEKKPLYWVAPMDANFRRDRPGKSPMGMDLVPVYEEPAKDLSPGTVKINPSVVNNLGVRTQTASKQRLSLPIKTVGYVKYNQDKLIHIHPRAEGWVDAIFVNSAGEKVTKDQPLYTLYSPQLVNAQEEFLLAASRKSETLTEAAIGRLKALQMPQQAIAQLQRNRQVMQSITFYAPQTGVVDNLNIREGFYVKPDKTLMSIASLDDVWVETEVLERMAGQVKVGQQVTMTMNYLPGRQWQGLVDYIYPNLDEQTRTLRARLRFDNQDGQLKPNMFAQIIIHVEQQDPSLIIPKEAVIRTGSQDRVVLALGDGEFKSVEVNLGFVRAGKAQILSGLKEGDEVVISAQFLLDSESSIHSDFLRMSAMPNESEASDDPDVFPTATVEGEINTIDLSNRLINITRGAIEKWGRGPATMDFYLSESIDIGSIENVTIIRFTFEIREGDFVIVELTPIELSGVK